MADQYSSIFMFIDFIKILFVIHMTKEIMNLAQNRHTQ